MNDPCSYDTKIISKALKYSLKCIVVKVNDNNNFYGLPIIKDYFVITNLQNIRLNPVLQFYNI